MNPPFESNTCRRAVNKLLEAMKKIDSSSSSQQQQLTFLIVLPEPQINTAEGKKFLQVFNSLEKSEFCVAQKSLAGKECAYLQGNQHHMDQQQQENETTSSISLVAVTLSAPTRLFVLTTNRKEEQEQKTLSQSLEAASEIWKSVSLFVSKEQDENAGSRRGRN